MNFLKQLGSIILKVTEIVAGIGPLFAAEVPGSSGTINVISKDLAQIGQIVVEAEAIGQALGLPGVQKLTGATPLVAQVILQSALLSGRSIDDPVLFQKGCGEVAGGIADILNSLKGNVDSTSKT